MNLIYFLLSGSILQTVFYFIFLIEKSRKQDHLRISPSFHKARRCHSPGSGRIVMKQIVLGNSPFPSPFCPSLGPPNTYPHPVPMPPQAHLNRGSFKCGILKIQKDRPMMVGFSLEKPWEFFSGNIAFSVPKAQPITEHLVTVLLQSYEGLVFITCVLLHHRMTGKCLIIPILTLSLSQCVQSSGTRLTGPVNRHPL